MNQRPLELVKRDKDAAMLAISLTINKHRRKARLLKEQARTLAKITDCY